MGSSPTWANFPLCARLRLQAEATPIPNQPPDRPRPPPPELLLKPLARLLRPLVRLLIQSGVTFPVFADLVRGLYLEVARYEALSDPKTRTDSRISLLTGIHRKEIRRQREPETPQAEPAVVTWATEIIGRWLGSSSYTDLEHRPLPLARSGAAPSFESLVASVTRDVRPRAVLDDWLERGLVTLDPEGRVRLSTEAFIPRQGGEAQLFYFARNLHDHIAAAAANIAAAQAPPFLDRSVHYDGLSADSASRLEAAAREAAQQLLLEINRLALELADGEQAQAGPAAPTRRVNLGLYLYAEDEQPGAESG